MSQRRTPIRKRVVRYIRKTPAYKSGFSPFTVHNTLAAAYAAGNFLKRQASRPSVPKPLTPKPKLRQRASANGPGGTRSKFFYGKRKLPRAFRLTYKAIAKNYKQLNGATRLAGSVGVQTPSVLLTMFNQTDLNSINSQLNSGNHTNRILYDSCSANIYLTNQDQGTVMFELYDCIARRDLSTSNVADPVTAWQNSYADENGANTDYKFVGATPFSSDLFTQFFRVKKITHVILSQGQVHQHQVHYYPRRLIDAEYTQYMGNGAKGLTCFTFIVARGAPYNDNTTKTTVSTGQVSLDIVYQKQYKYTYLSDPTTTWSATNSLAASFPVSEAIMDIGTGAAVASDTPA